MVYVYKPRGVFIQGVSGNLYTESEWYNQEVPNGVAVLTDKCEFVIALQDAYSSSCMWGSMNTEIDGIYPTRDSAAAKLYRDGESYTTTILNQLGLEDATAAYYCRDFTFPNGKKGYLGASGEWMAAHENNAAINSALYKCGGTEIYDTYWTSTLYDSSISWIVNWYTGLTYSGKNSNLRVRAFCSLD